MWARQLAILIIGAILGARQLIVYSDKKTNYGLLTVERRAVSWYTKPSRFSSGDSGYN
jgi:hypothetical protein